MRRTIVSIIAFAISFLILAYLFRRAWESDQFELLASAPKQWGQLIAGFALALSALCITFVRWFLLVRALDLPFRMFDAFRLGFIGYFLNFFTVGIVGGDTLKAIFIAHQIPSKRTHAVTSVFVDRAIGLFALFVLASFAFGLSDFSKLQAEHPEQHRAVKLVCYVAVACTAAGFVSFLMLSFAWRLESPFAKTLFRLPAVGGIFHKLLDAAILYHRRQRTVLLSIAMSIVVHVLNASAIYMIAEGLPGRHPDFESHLVIVPLSMVAGALPLPGGLGSFEWSLAFLYEGTSSDVNPSENGLIVAFAFRLVTLLIAAIGVVFYFAGKRELKGLKRLEEA